MAVRYDIDTWWDNCRAMFDVAVLRDRDRFFAEATFLLHDRLIFSSARFSPQRFDREPATMREFEPDFLLFERYISGAGHGVSVGTPTRVDAQTLHLVDVSQPFRTMTTAVETFGLWIPHNAIGYQRGQHPSYASCPLASPRGRLLSHAFRMLTAAFQAGRASEAEELATAFLALVRTLLLGERSVVLEEETFDGMANLLRGYVARKLDAEDLGVEHLCQEFRVSRATLYRLFTEDGSVRHYIQNQRLQRCLTQLLTAKAGRGQVRRIAERWGIDDAGNFNRCFRSRFGFAPSECLGTLASSSGTSRLRPLRGSEQLAAPPSTGNAVMDCGEMGRCLQFNRAHLPQYLPRTRKPHCLEAGPTSKIATAPGT